MPKSVRGFFAHLRDYWALWSAGTVFAVTIASIFVTGLWFRFGPEVKTLINEDVELKLVTLDVDVKTRLTEVETRIDARFNEVQASIQGQTRSIGLVLEKLEDISAPKEIAIYEYGQINEPCGETCTINVVVRRQPETVDCKLDPTNIEHYLTSRSDLIRRRTESIPGSAPGNVSAQPTGIDFEVRVPPFFPRGSGGNYQLCASYSCPWHEPGESTRQCSPRGMMPFTLTETNP